MTGDPEVLSFLSLLVLSVLPNFPPHCMFSLPSACPFHLTSNLHQAFKVIFQFQGNCLRVKEHSTQSLSCSTKTAQRIRKASSPAWGKHPCGYYMSVLCEQNLHIPYVANCHQKLINSLTRLRSWCSLPSWASAKVTITPTSMSWDFVCILWQFSIHSLSSTCSSLLEF